MLKMDIQKFLNNDKTINIAGISSAANTNISIKNNEHMNNTNFDESKPEDRIFNEDYLNFNFTLGT